MADDAFGILRPSNPSPQKTIVVLGAPRGGTSMVAASLRKLGIMMGENLGHQHEDPAFRREVPVEEMIQTINQRNLSHDVWGWKLPNSIYYVEELIPHLRNPHFVSIFRNPYSISKSSSERDKREYDGQLLHVAINHTRKMVDVINRLDAPTALASYETVMKRPRVFVSRLAAFVGVTASSSLVEEVVATAINQKSGYIRF